MMLMSGKLYTITKIMEHIFFQVSRILPSMNWHQDSRFCTSHVTGENNIKIEESTEIMGIKDCFSLEVGHQSGSPQHSGGQCISVTKGGQYALLQVIGANTPPHFTKIKLYT